MAESAVSSEVRRRRGERGYGLRELARRTGLSAGFISHVENAGSSVSIDSAFRLAVVLDCTVEDLLGADFIAAVRQEIAELAQTAVLQKRGRDSERERMRAEIEQLRAQLKAAGANNA